MYLLLHVNQDPDANCEVQCENVRYKTFDTLPDCTRACSNSSNFVTDECKICENLKFVLLIHNMLHIVHLNITYISTVYLNNIYLNIIWRNFFFDLYTWISSKIILKLKQIKKTLAEEFKIPAFYFLSKLFW